MKRITDRGFVYSPSYDTDISKRFRRMAKDQRAAAKQAAANAEEAAAKVATLKRKEGK